MSNILRVTLLLGSLILFAFIYRKLKKSQLHVSEAFFWITASTIFILLGIFPRIGTWFAARLGIISTSNFIFLCAIFILLIKTFLLTIKVSSLEHKITQLVEEIGIREQRYNEKKD